MLDYQNKHLQQRLSVRTKQWGRSESQHKSFVDTIFIFLGVMCLVNCPWQRWKDFTFYASADLHLLLYSFISVSLILKRAYLISFLALQPSLSLFADCTAGSVLGVWGENVFMHGVSAGVMAHSPITLTLSGNCSSLEKAWWNKCRLLTSPISQRSSSSPRVPLCRLRYLQTVISHK